MYYSGAWRGARDTWNNVFKYFEEYDNPNIEATAFAIEALFFIEVQFIKGGGILLACVNMREIKMVRVNFDGNTDEDECMPPSMYMYKPGTRMLHNILIPVNHLESKLGVTEENKTKFFFDYEGTQHDS